MSLIRLSFPLPVLQTTSICESASKWVASRSWASPEKHSPFPPAFTAISPFLIPQISVQAAPLLPSLNPLLPVPDNGALCLC